ncbi:unnamed protein product [Onchocerca flexuosa]|uniref:Ovule protein n=1 Tax=Onchocerca flexuosa TaxID=387005 RepID=A0A183I6L3_9BILA|nr:unnamed protein product [Onchocerca flexuosa]
MVKVAVLNETPRNNSTTTAKSLKHDRESALRPTTSSLHTKLLQFNHLCTQRQDLTYTICNVTVSTQRASHAITQCNAA